MITEKKGDFMKYKLHLLLAAATLIVGVGITGPVACAQNDTEVSLEDQQAISVNGDQQAKIQAPNFQLQTLDGKEVTLTDYRGKAVILNFWATWCPPCLKEIPDFVELTKTKDSDKFVILGVTLQSGTPEEIRKFAEERNMNYPVLTGEEAYLMKLTQLYGGIRGIPTTFVIGPDGRVHKKYLGPQTGETLWNDIQAVTS